MKKIVLQMLIVFSINGVAQQMKKADSFSYLRMNGDFVMDKTDSMTINDIRNPSRIVLNTTTEKGSITRMIFYSHYDNNEVEADCGYQFDSSRPDPYYFPNTSKTSIWDVFKKVVDYSGNCSKYTVVVSRSPHDFPLHMHLRYGDNVEKILNMSKDKKDDKFNPWWAEFKERK